MEPIKGGNLINLPEDALEPIKKSGLSPQNLALRFGLIQNLLLCTVLGSNKTV